MNNKIILSAIIIVLLGYIFHSMYNKNTGVIPTGTTKPVSRTPASTTKPASTSPASTSPASTSPASTSPASTSPASTSPASTSPASTSPASTSPASTSPASTSPASTSPASTSPASTSPASTSPTSTTTPASTSPASTTTVSFGPFMDKFNKTPNTPIDSTKDLTPLDPNSSSVYYGVNANSKTIFTVKTVTIVFSISPPSGTPFTLANNYIPSSEFNTDSTPPPADITVTGNTWVINIRPAKYITFNALNQPLSIQWYQPKLSSAPRVSSVTVA